jgi:hypothetical protein
MARPGEGSASFASRFTFSDKNPKSRIPGLAPAVRAGTGGSLTYSNHGNLPRLLTPLPKWTISCSSSGATNAIKPEQLKKETVSYA